jgi:hypothetical protein
MINKIKSYMVHRIMLYLSSHGRIKAFVKRVIYSSEALQKIAFKAVHADSHKSHKNELCNRRAQRTYEALKEGIAH